nr:hypothetical protein [Tanacetum cinerariifolium]
MEIVMPKMTVNDLENERPVYQHEEVPGIHRTWVGMKYPAFRDGDDGGRVVVVVCVSCDDDNDGVVGVAVVVGRDGGVEVWRVAVEEMSAMAAVGGDGGGYLVATVKMARLKMVALAVGGCRSGGGDGDGFGWLVMVTMEVVVVMTRWSFGVMVVRVAGDRRDGDDGDRVVVVVCVSYDDDDDGVVGVMAVVGRDGGVEVRRVAVEEVSAMAAVSGDGGGCVGG